MARLIAERSDVLPVLGEVFREHGYEGASLSVISKATGLGKGSLYHFFPGGKEDMAASVLDEIDAWFECHVFAPLRDSAEPSSGIGAMFEAVAAYFAQGRRVCLVGAFALADTRDRFAGQVRGYFARWTDALSDALLRAGHTAPVAQALAEDTVSGIQGALILGRAMEDPDVFMRTLVRLHERMAP